MREILSCQLYSLICKDPPLKKYIFLLQCLLKMRESPAECGRVGNYDIEQGIDYPLHLVHFRALLDYLPPPHQSYSIALT